MPWKHSNAKRRAIIQFNHVFFPYRLHFADTVFRCARACYNNVRARGGQGPSIDSEQRYCSKLHKLGSRSPAYPTLDGLFDAANGNIDPIFVVTESSNRVSACYSSRPLWNTQVLFTSYFREKKSHFVDVLSLKTIDNFCTLRNIYTISRHFDYIGELLILGT